MTHSLRDHSKKIHLLKADPYWRIKFEPDAVTVQLAIYGWTITIFTINIFKCQFKYIHGIEKELLGPIHIHS